MSLSRPAAEALNTHEKLVAWSQSVVRPRTVPREVQARLNRRTRELRESPDFLPEYFKGMTGAWMMAEVLAIVGTAVTAGVIAQVVGKGPAHVVAAVGIGVMAFCVAGVFVAMWWYYAARRAAREARRQGTSSDNYRRAVSRATSTGRTIPFQAGLGVVVTVMVLIT
jgi:hypothetical protein